jgi:hypothetical protein
MKNNSTDTLAYCRKMLRWVEKHKDQISHLEMMDFLSLLGRLLATAE